MVREYLSTDVFVPNAYPEYTYVSRSIDEEETYEEKLQRALRTLGLLTLISGSSKSGKTVLYHSVIDSTRMIEIFGSHIRTPDDFWKQIAEKLDIPAEIETSVITGSEVGVSGEISGSFVVAAGKGSMQTKRIDHDAQKEKKLRSNNQIIDALIRGDKVLVIDDFHYIPQDVQLYIARVLKSALFYGLKVVIVTLPHRADDAIRRNADLSGRVRFIDIEPWTQQELQKIPKTGFDLLGVSLSDESISLLVQESITSPQLMQQNCLNLAYILNVDEDPAVNTVGNIELIKRAFVFTIRDLEFYDSVLQKWTQGPSKGRDRRSKYQLLNQQEVEIYQLILYALAEDPPSTSIGISDLQRRIASILDRGVRVPAPLTLSNTMANIQKLLNELDEMYRVIDWRDQELHILDPYFLFYIRWTKLK